jgi:DNA polymerase-2
MPHPTTIPGWLFDVYPSTEGMTVWLIDQQGTRHRCTHRFTPSFFLSLQEPDARRVEVLSRRSPVSVSITQTERRDLYSNQLLSVLQVWVHDATRFRETVRYYEQFFPHFAFFHSDLLVAQLFLYETNLFPLAFGEYVVNEHEELIEWIIQDNREETDYALPELSILWMRNAVDFVPPKYQKLLQLEISYDGQTFSLEQHESREVLEALNWHLHRSDPDIIITEYGDSLLLPKIVDLAVRQRMSLLFNRDPNGSYTRTKESSFFQYGKIVHKDGAFELAGRWHIDAENSFTMGQADLEGIFELARLTQIPVQRQARASIGTSMSSMQLSWAHRNGYLIPAKKRQPEGFKSAATLLLADRGGLIFNPPFGYHEDVAELDFVSMYPTIMVERNVSPETVNCTCCKNNAVPELGYTICEKREGIIPATLRSVVKKRTYYKQRKRELKGVNDDLARRYDQRQNALKWMLVSCFGYLGYKNARFGRIEAHETVNAFSREAILTAKEIAEERGFHLLHAIIDCVWLKKEGATESEYEELCREIARRTNIDLSLEGIYRWILFPASKQDPAITTATRYVGWYRHSELKIRGIETRRRDIPIFIKNLQMTMLRHMADAATAAELEMMVPALLAITQHHLAVLRSGKANPMELVLRRHITKQADEYSNNSISAVVTHLVEQLGVHLAAGESIEFIIIDQSGKNKPEKAKPLALYAFEDGYDIEKYTELTLKAVETLLLPFGYDVKRLMEHFGIPRGKLKSRKYENMKANNGTLECGEKIQTSVPL